MAVIIRKFRSIFLAICLLVSNSYSLHACYFESTTDAGTITPELYYQILGIHPGERMVFEATHNFIYEFSLCNGNGSFDTRIEIYNNSGTLVDLNDDYCGLQSSISWNASESAQFYVAVFSGDCELHPDVSLTLKYKKQQNFTEQDCMGAIELCSYVIIHETSNTGTGVITDITSGGSCPSNCLVSGEINSIWYKFTPNSSGQITFIIEPESNSDDYDWAVYNLTGHSCEDIANNSLSPSSCSYSDEFGNTGLSPESIITCAGPSGDPFNAPLQVEPGETYVLYIGNYSSTQDGYTLTFSEAVNIINDDNPYMISASSPGCGSSEISLQFSENVARETIIPEIFTLMGPNGQINISGINCEACDVGGTYSDECFSSNYTLILDDPLNTGGEYSLNIEFPNAVVDYCNNHLADSGNIVFSINSLTVSSEVLQNTTCYGGNNGSAIIQVTGGSMPYNFHWSDGELLATSTQLSAGQNSVTITDNIGCISIVDVYISEPLPIIVDAGQDIGICAGNNVELGGSPTIINGYGEVQFEWSPSSGINNTISMNPLANPTSTTTYAITVQDSNGCTASDSVTIYCGLNLGTDLQVCSNSLPIDIEAGEGFVSYIWNVSDWDGQHSVEIENSGIYSVTVTTDDGCIYSDDIEITVIAFPEVNLGPDITVCSNDFPVHLDAGLGISQYFWNNIPGTNTFTVDTAGIYFVKASNSEDCFTIDSIVVNAVSSPLVSLTMTPESFDGAFDGSIISTVTDGTPPYLYLWDNMAISSSLENLEAGEYCLRVSDNNNCSVDNCVLVLLNQPPVAAFVADTLLGCGSLLVNFTDMSQGFPESFLWNFGDGNTSNEQHPVHLYESTGNFTVSLTVNNFMGSDQFIQNDYISIHDYPQISLNSQCESYIGASDGSVSVNISGSEEPYQYSWDNGTTQAWIDSLPSGNYCVSVYDNIGCSSSQCMAVCNLNGLHANFSADTITGCDSLTVSFVNLSVGDFISCLWSFGDGSFSTEINPVHTYVCVGVFDVSLTINSGEESNGLQKVEFIQINPTPNVQIEIIHESMINAFDGEINLTVSGGTPPYCFVWSNGATTEDITLLEHGLYYFTVIDSVGCSLSGEVIVGVIDVSPSNETSSISIIPNPFNNEIIIQLSHSDLPVRLKLFDACGHCVLAEEINGQNRLVRTEALAEGIYFYSITTANVAVYNGRIAKQH